MFAILIIDYSMILSPAAPPLPGPSPQILPSCFDPFRGCECREWGMDVLNSVFHHKSFRGTLFLCLWKLWCFRGSDITELSKLPSHLLNINTVFVLSYCNCWVSLNLVGVLVFTNHEDTPLWTPVDNHGRQHLFCASMLMPPYVFIMAFNPQ